MKCKTCGSKNISIERRIDGNVKCNHCKTTWKNTKRYYEQIAEQEEKSSNNWRSTDSPTSPEDQKINSAERVLKLDKDKE